jgi:predicted negative regulator of RcsB-dependent stress response
MKGKALAILLVIYIYKLVGWQNWKTNESNRKEQMIRQYPNLVKLPISDGSGTNMGLSSMMTVDCEVG